MSHHVPDISQYPALKDDCYAERNGNLALHMAEGRMPGERRDSEYFLDSIQFNWTTIPNDNALLIRFHVRFDKHLSLYIFVTY